VPRVRSEQRWQLLISPRRTDQRRVVIRLEELAVLIVHRLLDFNLSEVIWLHLAIPEVGEPCSCISVYLVEIVDF
jgi:hypothetical protein